MRDRAFNKSVLVQDWRSQRDLSYQDKNRGMNNVLADEGNCLIRNYIK